MTPVNKIFSMITDETMHESLRSPNSELVLSMHVTYVSATGISHLPNSGFPNARRLARRTDCGGGSLCVHSKLKDECFNCTALRSDRSYSCQREKLKVHQLVSPLPHVAHGTPIQLSVAPSLDAPTGKESFIAANLVPMQSAHHARSVMEKCQADADDIVGMLEAITRSYHHVDPSPIRPFTHLTSLKDLFSIRESAPSTADSFGQAPDPSIGCPLQQPAICQNSFLQSKIAPYNSAFLNPASQCHSSHPLPLHECSIIEQPECSQLMCDSAQHFHSHMGPSEAGCFFNQRQDLSYLRECPYQPQPYASVFSLDQEQKECISYPIQESKSHGSLNLPIQEFYDIMGLQQTDGCVPFIKQIVHAQPVVVQPRPRKKRCEKASFRHKKVIGALRTDSSL